MLSLLKYLSVGLFFLCAFLNAKSTRAGVFNTPHFVEPGKNAVGVEPEYTLTNGGGLAANLRYQHGISDLTNATFIVGGGSGVRQFRIGFNLAFDFYPDDESQPGIGFAVQPVYYRYKGNFGQLDLNIIPYMHKTFYNQEGDSVEPFVALPWGFEFRERVYDFAATLALGAHFKKKGSQVVFVTEVGAKLKASETYVSGGIILYP